MNASGGWDPIFNPSHNTARVLNHRNLSLTYDPSTSIELPIQNPYGEFTLSDNVNLNQNLFVSSYSASTSDIYKFEMSAFAFGSPTTNRIPGATNSSNYYIEGYFKFEFNSAFNSKMASKPSYIPIPKEGTAKFYLKNDKLLADIAFPEGGSIGYEVYDLTGRKLGESTHKVYDAGTYLNELDLNTIPLPIYIVRYTLNGINHSIKLGSNN